MTLDYTAIDFETANRFRGSPCSVGLVKVRDGRVVDERYWLMRPPTAVSTFSPFNISVHGIGEDDVRNEPAWRDRYREIMSFVGEDVLVAHNAGFDIGVLREACAIDELPFPSLNFLCTMVMARKALSVPSYRLPFIAESLGAPAPEHHHNALDDAHCVVAIVNGLAKRCGAGSIHDLASAHQVVVGHMAAGTYRSSVSKSGSSALLLPDVNPDADPEGPLYGRVVVFTGSLMAMPRQDAMTLTAHVGGIPEKNTTKRTNVLVVGDLNPAVLRPGENLSGKARRAFELQDAGQEIEVMTEVDFLRALQGGREDPWEVLAETATAPIPLASVGRGARRTFHLERFPGEDYWPWFERVLAHPMGRAQGGEPCDHCGAPIPAKAAWQQRDRHVCSGTCNEGLRRRLKRAMRGVADSH